MVLFTPHCIVCFFFTIYTVNPSDPNMNTLIIWMWVFTNNQNIHTINTTITSANGVVCLSYVTQMAILSNKVTIPCLFKLWGMNFVCVLFGILNSCKICFGKQWRCKCTSQTTREQENQNRIHFHWRFSKNSWKLQQNFSSVYAE